MMAFRKGISLLAGALLLAGPAAQAQVAPPPAPAQVAAPAAQAQVFARLGDAEIARRVSVILDRFKARPELVGLSVAVARGDHVVLDEGIGIADLEWNAPADASTPFRIGSLTKQFTAAAIMKLAERGKLGLDDPLAKYVPDFDTGGRTVTIRQLLNHASGIPNYTDQPGFIAKAGPLDLTDQELLALVAGKPFDFEPGKGWRYSNTGYYLLGMIVAKASGRSYADFLQDEFFKPLGLTHTRYGSESAIIPRRAQGYGWDPATRERSNDRAISMNTPGAAGALVSTAGDLVRWQIALTGGRAISPASYQQMIDSTVKVGRGDAAYGFGLFIETRDGQRRISHTGGINGFNSALTWLPDAGLRVAIISNSEAMASTTVQEQIIAALTSDTLPPPPRATAQPGAEAALRKLIADIANGTPDYASMAPGLAEAVRTQLPQVQPQLKARGAISSVTFVTVDPGGTVDSYRVAFADGSSTIFTIALLPDGKIGRVNF